jgi:hypothetical protein
MTLIEPLGPELTGGFGEIKERVIATLTSLLITDERVTETELATLANMEGNETPAIVSTATLFSSKVDITRLSFVA